MSVPPPTVPIGLGFGLVRHWHDGLGEFSRQLGLALATMAPALRDELGWQFHFHLPARWHGQFGTQVGYLGAHTGQRLLHLQPRRFALWHGLHQHNRLQPPLGTRQRIVTVHDLNFLRLKQGASRERHLAALQKRLARCDGAIAITHFVAAELSDALQPSTLPVTVIHNGATDLTAAPRQPVDGIDPNRPYLLHISRLAPSKNIDALLDLAAAWPQMPLVLAGASSPYADTVRAAVASRRLENVLIRLDIEEAQKAWLYAHCAGFLFPSLTEGFGLPPIEAMHFGKPVFLSRLTSLPEVGGDSAHYFDGFSADTMRTTIAAGLAADAAPGRAEAIAAHARSFSWQRCAEQHVALYRRLLAA